MTINIDPTVGIENVNDDQMSKPSYEMEGNGKTSSPATSLLHELGHAMGFIKDPKAFDDRMKQSDPLYTNKEEERVIKNIENPFAMKKASNGESVRTNHGGIPIITEGPTSTKMIDITPAEKKRRAVQKLIQQQTNPSKTN